MLALLVQAIWRLTPLALEPLQTGELSAAQSALYVGWVLFSMYTEGYRGFQKRFSPRVVARALHLVRHPRPLHVLLAPLFCMSLFHATRRTLAGAWGVTCMVIVLVVLIRYLPQPWRGIIDGGVVIGLLWGAVALVVYALRALSGRHPGVPAEVPGG